MHAMAGLLADFIIEGIAFIDANLDDFTWTGADVYVFDGNGERVDRCYSCSSMEKALTRKDEPLGKYPLVAVRDNETRKERMFWRQRKRKERWTHMRGEDMWTGKTGTRRSLDGFPL